MFEEGRLRGWFHGSPRRGSRRSRPCSPRWRSGERPAWASNTSRIAHIGDDRGGMTEMEGGRPLLPASVAFRRPFLWESRTHQFLSKREVSLDS